jgi:uncharacterized protein
VQKETLAAFLRTMDNDLSTVCIHRVIVSICDFHFMPRRLFKRISRQRHTLRNRWFLRPFRAVLEHPAYWSLHRRSITLAVALGIFIAFIPLPVHTIGAVVAAIMFRINVPVTIASVFISNPLTMVPQYYLCYRVGAVLLDYRSDQFAFEMSWAWIKTGFLPIWQPLVLGCLVLGAASAAISYVLLRGIWHTSLVLKYHQRKRKRKANKSANEEKVAGGEEMGDG